MQDSQGQILALAFRSKTPHPFQVFTLRLEAAFGERADTFKNAAGRGLCRYRPRGQRGRVRMHLELEDKLLWAGDLTA